jgi:hypothetical protein
MNVQKYLSKYEVVSASEEGKKIVFVPYEDQQKVSRYLKKTNTSFKLRHNHDYTISIYAI